MSRVCADLLSKQRSQLHNLPGTHASKTTYPGKTTKTSPLPTTSHYVEAALAQALHIQLLEPGYKLGQAGRMLLELLEKGAHQLVVRKRMQKQRSKSLQTSKMVATGLPPTSDLERLSQASHASVDSVAGSAKNDASQKAVKFKHTSDCTIRRAPRD